MLFETDASRAISAYEYLKSVDVKPERLMFVIHCIRKGIISDINTRFCRMCDLWMNLCEHGNCPTCCTFDNDDA